MSRGRVATTSFNEAETTPQPGHTGELVGGDKMDHANAVVAALDTRDCHPGNPSNDVVPCSKARPC
jgi:hypothetical protein